MSQPKYRRIDVAALTTDDRYQRELSPARVRKIVANFDARQLGVIEVSERADGTLAVFDGQHRLAALRELGVDRVACLMHELSPEEEAALFARLQLDRKALSTLDRFRAQLFAGEEQAVALNELVEQCGMRISNRENAGEHGAIRAVGALERIYKREGPEVLRMTLTIAIGLWGGDAKSTDGYLLEGLAQFWRGYENRLTDGRLGKLADVPPSVILRRALGSMQGGGSHARHAVDAELRKITGVRGRPVMAKPTLVLAEVA